jgi:hypothetical protein
MKAIPKKVEGTFSYPPRPFFFTGKWEQVTLGNRRVAYRNRKTVFVPVYQAEDGEEILLMWLQTKDTTKVEIC